MIKTYDLPYADNIMINVMLSTGSFEINYSFS